MEFIKFDGKSKQPKLYSPFMDQCAELFWPPTKLWTCKKACQHTTLNFSQNVSSGHNSVAPFRRLFEEFMIHYSFSFDIMPSIKRFQTIPSYWSTGSGFIYGITLIRVITSIDNTLFQILKNCYKILASSHLGGIHKMRWQSRGRGIMQMSTIQERLM